MRMIERPAQYFPKCVVNHRVENNVYPGHFYYSCHQAEPSTTMRAFFRCTHETCQELNQQGQKDFDKQLIKLSALIESGTAPPNLHSCLINTRMRYHNMHVAIALGICINDPRFFGLSISKEVTDICTIHGICNWHSGPSPLCHSAMFFWGLAAVLGWNCIVCKKYHKRKNTFLIRISHEEEVHENWFLRDWLNHSKLYPAGLPKFTYDHFEYPYFNPPPWWKNYSIPNKPKKVPLHIGREPPCLCEDCAKLFITCINTRQFNHIKPKLWFAAWLSERLEQIALSINPTLYVKNERNQNGKGSSNAHGCRHNAGTQRRAIPSANTTQGSR